MSKAKLTIFKNNNAGQPVKKKDGSIVEYDGKPMLQPALNGKINLPEGLPAGDYEVAIYQYTSDKNPNKPPLKYYSGTIKATWKKPEVSGHSKDKANGYAPSEKKLNLNDIDENENMPDLDDDIPF